LLHHLHHAPPPLSCAPISHAAAADSEQAVSAAVKRARDAITALAEPPTSLFFGGMQSALQKAEAALQREPRGSWSWALPHKHNHLTKLRESDPRRPAREEAYAAMANLKAVGFAAASSTDRSRVSILSKRQKRVDDAAAGERAACDGEARAMAPSPHLGLVARIAAHGLVARIAPPSPPPGLVARIAVSVCSALAALLLRSCHRLFNFAPLPTTTGH